MAQHRDIKSQIKKTEVAIVGGGMVGMSLALMLSKKRCCDSITLIEPGTVQAQKSAEWSPSFDDRSTALSAGTISLFEQLHLWAELSIQASLINVVKVSDRGHLGFTQYTKHENAGQALGAVVENAAMGRVLLDAVLADNNIHIVDKTSVSNITLKSNGAELRLETAGQMVPLLADLVVLADGALSGLASSLGIQFDKHKYNQHAVVANVAHSQPHDGRAFECFSERGPLALLPLTNFRGEYRSALVWTNDSDAVSGLKKLTKPQFLKALQTQFGYRLGTFTNVGELATYPLNLYLAKEQVRSSLVLMGNAAHFLHPVAGQGFNLSARDCAELCTHIEAGKQRGLRAGDLSILQNYQKTREWDQQLTTRLGHGFIKMFASAHPAKQLTRNAALVAMHKFGPLRSQFFSQMMGKSGKGIAL